MTHYLAILEDGGETQATGVWFPDLPGCFSGGDSLDEALTNAPEAVRMYLESLIADGLPLPPPRGLAALKADPAWANDIASHVVALVPVLPAAFRPAAE